jgi:hypothetical protein
VVWQLKQVVIPEDRHGWLREWEFHETKPALYAAKAGHLVIQGAISDAFYTIGVDEIPRYLSLLSEEDHQFVQGLIELAAQQS